MRRTLAPDTHRLLIALAAVPLALFGPPSVATLSCIVLGALLGLLFLRNLTPANTGHALDQSISTRSATVALTAMVALLAVLPALAAVTHAPTLAVASAFYRSGALVFGGGHVVLPLLQATTVDRGWLDAHTFLAGYGAAQAVPGPLFTFAAFLGYRLNTPPNHLLGAAIALVGIFLPGLLLAAGMLPFWARFSRLPRLFAALAGINAAVIGLLAAALYKPGWTSAIRTPIDALLLAAALLALLRYKLAPWKLLAATVAVAVLLTRFGWMH